MATSSKKSNSNKKIMVFGVLCACVAAVVALVFILNQKEDYYSDKYARDYNWYMGTCTEAMSNSFEATTMIYCDCGYYEFRNIYGPKKIYGELSAADVLGWGQTISDDKLMDNVKTCYDSEVAEYKKEHPGVDIDKAWKEEERIIVPKRVIKAGELDK